MRGLQMRYVVPAAFISIGLVLFGSGVLIWPGVPTQPLREIAKFSISLRDLDRADLVTVSEYVPTGKTAYPNVTSANPIDASLSKEDRPTANDPDCPK